MHYRISATESKFFVLTIGISIVLHALCAPFVGRAILSPASPQHSRTELITQLLDDMSRERDHKSETVDHNQIGDSNHVNIDPIDIALPLAHQRTITTPSTVQHLNPTHYTAQKKIKRRQQLPLSRRSHRLQQKYTKTMAQRIGKNMPYIAPQHAPSAEARVVIRIVINPVNGALKDISLHKSSGSWAFDQAALMAIKKSAPFPPVDIEWEELVFTIPMRYRK
jgi:TonB family protein